MNVTARLLKGVFDGNRDRISEALTVRDIQVARLVQFIVSMGPTVEALSKGYLDSLRPIEEKGSFM